MKLPVYNLVVREQRYDDDARGDADDARLHTNSDGEGADTIRHKHNDDDDGNFYDDDDDDKEKDADIDDNDAENGNGGHVNDDDDNNKLIKHSSNSNIYVVHRSIVITMVPATTRKKHRIFLIFEGIILCPKP